MIRAELLTLARRWAEPSLAAAATLAALWVAGATTLRWGWLTLALSAVIVTAGGLWMREAVRRVRLADGRGGAGHVYVEERRILYVGSLGNVQVDLDAVTRIDLARSRPNGAHRAALLLHADGPPAAIPLGAEGEDALLDALLSLPGFRLEALSPPAESGTALTAPLVTIWQRP